MNYNYIDLAIKVVICFAFSFFALKFKILDSGGTLFAVIIGAIIIFTKGIGWFALLLIFLAIGAGATRYRYAFKRKRLQERPLRKAMNVIANGLIPALLAFFSFFLKQDLSVPFVASISVALADTFASEIGVLSNNAYLITNLRKVEPGTNGAVSLLGEIVAFAGAFIISFLAYFLLELTPYEVILCVILGLLGCHIDSVLGATFQGKGKGSIVTEDTVLTNSDVNLISIAITTLVAFIIVKIL